MSFSIIRKSVATSARVAPAIRLGYRPLVNQSNLRCLGAVQPLALRSFSSSMVHFNNQQQTEKLTIGARLGKLYQNSKDLIRFYKDGLKLIWNNNKKVKELEKKLITENYELNRAEFQLIHQTKKDMLKLIPFGIIFMILPESIPLWVIYVPSMIPSTCLKDNQIQKQREKLDKARQKMSLNVLKSVDDVEGITPDDFLTRSKFIRLAKQFAYDFDLTRIDRRHLSAYCRFMGVSDLGPQFILKNRLSKYMDYIEQDDKLLVKDNFVDSLDIKDLSHACEERGMRSVNQDEENMRRGLKYWLSLTQPENPAEKVIPPGLLVFSRMFLLNANYKGKQRP